MLIQHIQHMLHNAATKATVTAAQRENAVQALEFMKGVPEEAVIRRLEDYRKWDGEAHCTGTPTCNTPACFGGWLPYVPHFAAQGVHAGDTGVPLLGEQLADPYTLFGVDGMFSMQFVQEPRQEFGTPKEVVLRRLQTLINQSEVV